MDDFDEIPTLEPWYEMGQDIGFYVAEARLWSILESLGEYGQDLVFEVRTRVGADHCIPLVLGDGIETNPQYVNSTCAVAAAVESEIIRQAKVLDAGETITHDTRHWDEEARSTRSGRPNSDADDYRYFPDPDLAPIVIDDAWVERLRADLPENPVQQRRRSSP